MTLRLKRPVASKWQIWRAANVNYPPRVEAFRLRAREDIMKAIHSIIAAAALAFVLPSPANAATTNPEVIIYRVSWRAR